MGETIASIHKRRERDPDIKRFIKSLGLHAHRNERILFHGVPCAGARDASDKILFTSATESPLHAEKHQGFDVRLGSIKGMYGSGTYFADMASKADQYAGRYNESDNPAGSVGELATMFLTRVTLGCPYLTNQSLERLRRPPCIEGHFDLDLSWNTEVLIGKPWPEKEVTFSICSHPRFDSVMGDLMIEGHKKLYREYVVYEMQAYPEYCIYYERTD